MKHIITIALTLAAMIGLTACSSLTSTEKAAVKQEIKTVVASALAMAGEAAYAQGRVRLDSWLTEQVTSGKITEVQKAAALAAADKGGADLKAYLTSIATASSAASAANTGTTAGTAAAMTPAASTAVTPAAASVATATATTAAEAAK